MSYLIDLIGSLILASYVILTGLRFNLALSGTADATAATVNVQESMVDITRSLEYDFRKIGYNVSEAVFPILDTSATRITFLADIDRNGVTDTIRWYAGVADRPYPNPKIISLYRKVNSNAAISVGVGVTTFSLRYLDQDGHPPASLGAIYTIEITLELQSPYKIQDQVVTDQEYDSMGYATVFWRQTRLASRNIQRHG
jgi:hypothetical protein